MCACWKVGMSFDLSRGDTSLSRSLTSLERLNHRPLTLEFHSPKGASGIWSLIANGKITVSLVHQSIQSIVPCVCPRFPFWPRNIMRWAFWKFLLATKYIVSFEHLAYYVHYKHTKHLPFKLVILEDNLFEKKTYLTASYASKDSFEFGYRNFGTRLCIKSWRRLVQGFACLQQWIQRWTCTQQDHISDDMVRVSSILKFMSN